VGGCGLHSKLARFFENGKKYHSSVTNQLLKSVKLRYEGLKLFLPVSGFPTTERVPVCRRTTGIKRTIVWSRRFARDRGKGTLNFGNMATGNRLALLKRNYDKQEGAMKT
jgi:hypothetical protein